MSWSRIAELWDDLVDQLVARWPEMDRELLVISSGAPDTVVAHLAEAHDLTVNEAAEELDLWRAQLIEPGIDRAA